MRHGGASGHRGERPAAFNEVVRHGTSFELHDPPSSLGLIVEANGVANTRIAARVCVTAVTVRALRKRFGEDGLAKLGEVHESRGPKPSTPAETVAAIVEATLHSRPSGQTHWSTWTMATQFGVSRSTVHEIWPQNREHEVDNLYVVDGSFFPSSTSFNPSLTIAANALRVAARVNQVHFAT